MGFLYLAILASGASRQNMARTGTGKREKSVQDVARVLC
jgi:hypothetical protein